MFDHHDSPLNVRQPTGHYAMFDLGSPRDVEKPLRVGEPADRSEEHGVAHAAQ